MAKPMVATIERFHCSDIYACVIRESQLQYHVYKIKEELSQWKKGPPTKLVSLALMSCISDQIILSQKFLADTIERSSEVEVEAGKGYAIWYVKYHTSCDDW